MDSIPIIYILTLAGGHADFDLSGLVQIYKDVTRMNTALVERFQGTAKGDAIVNALVILDSYVQLILMALEESFADIHYVFAPYLKTLNRAETSTHQE